MKQLFLLLTAVLFWTANLAAQTAGKNGLPVPNQGEIIGGTDVMGLFHFLLVNPDGSIVMTPSGGGIAGDATALNQTTEITKLTSIDGKTPTLVSGRQPVDGSGVTQPISAASLPLPSGASTSANQTTGNTSLATIATNTTGAATAANQATANTSLATLATNLPAKGSAAPTAAMPVIQATSTTVVSTALEASHVLKASAGSLVSVHWLNTKVDPQFILIMNSATVPANGAVTLLYPPISVPASSNGSLTFPTPLTASTGIAISNSSTGTFTKTIGAADCIFLAQVQ